MQASTDELVTIIGEQAIALRLLRAELQEAQAQVVQLQAEKTEAEPTNHI